MGAYEEITGDVGNLVDQLGYVVDDAAEKFHQMTLAHGREHPETLAASAEYDRAWTRYETAYAAYKKAQRTSYDDS
jgi:hypothetical protein